VKIEARHLGKEFRLGRSQLAVLHDVNLIIEDGRFVCLLGPSGCGKSTFLRCVAGLERPSTGEIVVDGAPVRTPGPDRTMVFQDYALFPWYTVEQNILFGLRLRHNRQLRSLDHSKVLSELVALVGLQGFEGAYPHQISGGMRQRVGLARALAVNPGALLMDEPFAAIDAITREGLQRQMVDVWRKTRKTVLFVTHSVDEAAFLGDEVHVFGARPASIRESIAISLPRPRDVADPAFAEIVNRLRRAIDSGGAIGQEAAA
jgi:ABC-type nitrate/sulfonate/bicarbonate transport system ATPase subunit